MKYFKPRVVVIPHYIGTQNKTELFKKIFMEQVEKKLNEKKSAESTDNNLQQETTNNENK